MNSNKTILAGAVIGTLIGSISAILRSNRKNVFSQMTEQARDWTTKAQDIGQKVFNDVDRWRNPPPEMRGQTFAAGALCGLLVGIGSALLLAPKTGKQLRNELAKTYNSVSDKTQEVLQFINHEPLIKRRPALKQARHPTKPKAKSHSHK